MNKAILIVVVVIVALGAVLWLVMGSRAPVPEQPPTDGNGKTAITSFQECIAAGYPIMESYPRQCRTPDGKGFVEDIGNELEKTDLIRIDTPRPNQNITSPLVIAGEARGYWFFEADFPVMLYDADNNLLGTAVAYAQGEWMTEEFVPFRAELDFTASGVNRGELILQKDNPSGLPEHADELRVPVSFAVTAPPVVSHGGPVEDYVSFVDNLRAKDLSVEPAGEAQQPFFSVTGYAVLANGENVQAFEYETAEAADAETSSVSPDGSSVGTTMITWVAPPHFFKKAKLIVLYVGEDETVLAVLEAVLGPQFAGR